MGKWIAIVVGAVVVLAGAAFASLYLVFPRVSEPGTIKVDRTLERVQRGTYLANAVMGCVDCHSRHEEDIYSMPPVRTAEFGGGLVFSREMGLPGNIVSRNITPGVMEDWTDGEFVRAITAGVSRDGRVLFPVMPYHTYGTLDREDIYSVVAYLRVIQKVTRAVPDTEIDFPVSLLIRLTPADPTFHTRPNPRDTVAYGRYMVAAAGCAECHTQRDAQGNPAGPAFGGGQDMLMPRKFLARPANITPDTATGIGTWTKEAFIARFKSRTEAEYRTMRVEPGQPNTFMPWWAYASMTPEDLAAIYDYLRTVAPVSNKVVTFEPR